MLTLIKNVVTHIFQFMPQSLYSTEYTIDSACSRAEDFVFKHMSRQAGDRAKSSRSRLTAAV